MPNQAGMHEADHNDPENKENIIDMAIKRAGSFTENEIRNSHKISIDNDVTERRKYPRSEFTYPADFKIFYKNIDQLSFTGYLKDISINGACLQFEDKYGRLKIEDASNVRIKLSFSIPNDDKVIIFAQIKWITKPDPKTFLINIAIEFKNMEDWQLEIVEKLIGMRNKDHNMMWNLWEQYNTNWK